MCKSRFTETELVYAVKQVEAGVAVAEVARKYGVSLKTIYAWRAKYGSLSVSEVARLKQLEEENRKLKQMVAELALDKQMLQDVLRKKIVRPAVRRELVHHAMALFRVSERRACRSFGWPRNTQRYRPRRDPALALRIRLRDLAMNRPRYGYRRLWVLLRREDWVVNHKRVLRVYREEDLAVRHQAPQEARGPAAGASADAGSRGRTLKCRFPGGSAGHGAAPPHSYDPRSLQPRMRLGGGGRRPARGGGHGRPGLRDCAAGETPCAHPRQWDGVYVPPF